MNKLITAIIALCMLAMGWSSTAVAQDTKVTPVDYRSCNFRKGKSMKDLDKFTTKFREYANANNAQYSAWTVHPQYATDVGYDVGWMGAWPSAEDFGVSIEQWNAEGADLKQIFYKALDCPSHAMFGSLPINAASGPPEDGVWMAWQCNLNEGVTIPQAYQAYLDAGLIMKGMGSLGVSWFWQPIAGTGAIDYDFMHIVAFYRYSDMGATTEMYLNHKGRIEQQKILSKVATCRLPNIFDTISVRAFDER